LQHQEGTIAYASIKAIRSYMTPSFLGGGSFINISIKGGYITGSHLIFVTRVTSFFLFFNYSQEF